MHAIKDKNWRLRVVNCKLFLKNSNSRVLSEEV